MFAQNKKHTTTVLIILDGWGIADQKQAGNAITSKTAPNYFKWFKKYPHTQLRAEGASVGLFKNQEGNSEAGHLNIGAGRVVRQDALYISDAINDGTFFKNIVFQEALNQVKKNNSAIHLVGLLSNGNSAHSLPEHLYALLDLCNSHSVKKVYLHLFTDGRDSGQHDALKYLKNLEKHFYGNEKIATIAGRYFGMDRNKEWKRTQLAFEAMVLGSGKNAQSVSEAVTVAYNSGETDEFISPTVITEKGKPVATIKNGDAVLFFNLRSDRARQLAKVFVQSDFEKINPDSFKRKNNLKDVYFAAMTDFGPDLPGLVTAFPSRDVVDSLVKILCPRRQLYISESEKFAHITYFFNGGYAQHFCDERWVKIESDHVKDFESRPAMKAKEIADYIIKAVESKNFDFIAANFANADMVGHTGNFIAAKETVRVLDCELARIAQVVEKTLSLAFVTADHGNVEEMVTSATGEINSEHSTNPVPFFLVGNAARLSILKLKSGQVLPRGKLCDVAPTILKCMGITKPPIMTGKSLV